MSCPPATFPSWNHAGRTIRRALGDASPAGRLARGAVWALAGALCSQGAALAAAIVAARLLGLEDFGRLGMVQSTAGMLGVFAGMGLGVTGTKYVAELRERDPARAGRVVALGTAAAAVSGGAMGLALAAGAPWLAGRTLAAPELAPALRIAALLLWFNAVSGAQSGALAGLEAFPAIARIHLCRGLFSLPATALAVWLWGLAGAVWALAATAAATCALARIELLRVCRRAGIRPRLRGAWAERRLLWRFSLPALLGGALASPVLWAAQAMLANQPGGYAAVGVFSAASHWRSAIGFLPGVLAQSALPVLANLHGGGEAARFRQALTWNLRLTALSAGAVALPVALAAPFLMRSYGAGFERGAAVLALSAAAGAICALNGVAGTAILSGGSVWTGLVFNALWAGVFLAGCRWLVPSHLALGLSVSLLAAYLAHSGWQAAYLLKRLRLSGRPAGGGQG